MESSETGAAESAAQQTAGQEGKDVPKREPSPDAGKYVVLAQDVNAEGGDDSGIYEVGTYPAESQIAAKKAAIAAHEELKTKISGPGIKLAAVPKASWKLQLVKAETPPPVLRGL